MCSLAVSTQDSPAVEPRSNPGSGKILMSENLRLYTTSPGYYFDASLMHHRIDASSYKLFTETKCSPVTN